MKRTGLIQFLGITILLSLSAMAEVPATLSLQGQLNGPDGLPVDGLQTIIVRLYLEETGGTAVWTETQDVTFDLGKFTVLLGSVTALDLDFSEQYWMGISIDTDPELSPRIPLSSTGYALRGKFVESLTEENVRQFWTLVQSMPDADDDGHEKISVGGNDCDDLNPYINPDAIEVCDNVDNDCDGMIDNNAAGASCPTPVNVSAVGCLHGECVILQCDPGYDDANGLFFDGCESPCPPDICDGLDNDCDPGTPDGFAEPLLGMPCDGPDSDLCQEGVWDCVAGNLICTDNTGDTLDVCDTLDNDCDGTPDNGGSLCGPNPAHAYWICVAGQCVWECEPNFYNLDDDIITNGCEYACEYTSAVDGCDDVDNDCDGLVDEDCFR